MAARKSRYKVIRSYTSEDFKEKVSKYCDAVGKTESKVVKEALNKLINGKNE